MALYHSAKGSVDYTIVGSPTIVDGVASGFSASDYLSASISTPSNFNSISGSIRFQTGSSFSNENLALLAFYHLRIGWTTAGKPGIRYYDDGTEKTSYFSNSLSTNKEYTINFNITATTIDIALYDGNTLVEIHTYSGNFELPFNRILDLGRAGSAAYLQYTSIDLNNTYVKVNGQPWFGICPVEVKKHQIMGPVGYTVVGSPTITDGVASGFSGRDYLNIPNVNFANPFEIQVRVKYSDIVSGRAIFGMGNAQKLVILVNSGGYFNIATKTNPNDAYIYNNISWTKVQANTWYWIRIVYDGSGNYNLQFSRDGRTFSSKTEVGSTLTGNGDFNLGFAASAMVSGSIDLNNTYIKVNGKLWFWQPQETKYIQRNNQLVFADPKLYLSGPVNYEVVGNPTIVDGVASGFASRNYIATEGDTDFNQPFEILISCIKGPNRNQTIFSRRTQNNGVDVTFPYNNRCIIQLWLNNSVIYNVGEGMGGFVLEENTKYVMKFTYDGNDRYYFAILSHITKDVLYARTIIESTKLNNCGVTFGGKLAERLYNPWEGSIDLNETYIKVNGKLWFYGKNYATQNIAPVPSGYTFGTTTTSSIGYVDMRTQTFYSAPQGAIIGRDE